MEYSVDAHAMASLIPHDNYDLVVANSVFEHMKQPFVVACRAAWKSQPLTRRVDRHAIAAPRSLRETRRHTQETNLPRPQARRLFTVAHALHVSLPRRAGRLF